MEGRRVVKRRQRNGITLEKKTAEERKRKRDPRGGKRERKKRGATRFVKFLFRI